MINSQWKSSLILVSAFLFLLDSAIAQVIPDNTLGEESSLVNSRNATSDSIDGGAIRGQNLFHSFQEFNVDAGRGVYFSNPEAVTNIFSRVTGNNVSNILGTLGVDGAADLFLINPNGIIFGEDASLDVNGSFAATTASGIEFGTQGSFNAINPQTPQLLTINPSAFLFNQINSNSTIQNNSLAAAGQHPAGFNLQGLRVPNGNSLILLGGDIVVDRGRLNAVDGRIELGGLSDLGVVELNIDNQNLSLSFPENVAKADVSLTDNAIVTVSGETGGEIAINANNLDVVGGSSILAGIETGLGNPNVEAGNITIKVAENIYVDNSLIANSIESQAAGNAGDVFITAGNLSVINSADINASTFGKGNAGQIFIQIDGSINLQNAGIFSNVENEANGNGSNVNIQAGAIIATEGGRIQSLTRGQGNAGQLEIEADEISLSGIDEARQIFSGFSTNVESDAEGDGGVMEIKANSLSLTDGAQIQAIVRGTSFDTRPGGIGNGGDINIEVNDAITIMGKSNSGLPSGIFTELGENAIGNGGNISIEAKSFSLTEGGLISSELWYGAEGNGGSIDIQASSSFLSENARISSFGGGTGNTGNILIQAGDVISLSETEINSRKPIISEGNVGEIFLKSGSIFLTDTDLDATSQADSSEGRGNGGKVSIFADKSATFIRSSIDTGVGFGSAGKGGDIIIRAGSLSLSDESFIDSETRTGGTAGNISIEVEGLFSLVDSQITSANFNGEYVEGIAGNTNIKAGSLSLSEGSEINASNQGREDNLNTTAGNISIEVDDAIFLSDSSIFSKALASDEEGNDRGGRISLKGDSLTLTDAAQISVGTESEGDAGDISIKVDDFVFLTNGSSISSVVEADRNTKGNGGNIQINARSITLDRGAQFNTSVLGETKFRPGGQGNGGNMIINASDSINLSGFNPLESELFRESSVLQGASTGFYAVTERGATGQGGNILVNTNDLSITDGAVITAQTFNRNHGGDIKINSNNLNIINGGQILSSTFNEGNAGEIELNITDKLTISASDPKFFERLEQFGRDAVVNSGADSGLFVNTDFESTGNGGAIFVIANTVNLNNRAKISAQSQGRGDAGGITLELEKDFNANDSNVITSATQSTGGQINIFAQRISLNGDSNIRTNVEDGLENGGNITLNADSIIAFDDSDIFAFAADGKGGNITLDTSAFFAENFTLNSLISNPETLENNSRADLNATGAVSGAVDIPDVSFIQNSLTELPDNSINTNELVANSCVAPVGNRQQGRFIITGGDSLPVRPGNADISDFSTGEVRSVPQNSSWQRGEPIIEPQGVYRLTNGKIVLSRQCL